MIPPSSTPSQQQQIQPPEQAAPANAATAPPEVPAPSSNVRDPFVTPENIAIYGETLVQPITVETIKDLNQLNEKRKQLLQEAEYAVKTQAKLDQQLAEVKKTMEEANNLKTEYKRMIAAKDVAHNVAKNDPTLR